MKTYSRRLSTWGASLAIVATIFSSCTKEEMNEAPLTERTEATEAVNTKALSFFIKVNNGTGTPAFGDGCSLWMNTQNGGVGFKNQSPCLLGNGSVGVGGTALQECFQQVDCAASNQWNWIRAVAGPANRKWLRFRFDYSFNYTAGSGNLVTYNYTTGIWSVNTAIPGFCWELRNAGDQGAPSPC